ncbi:MAG: SUMF1/EgtB/PvdO family nonheme iron enzyme [Muribaculaceae bacterium]|nr:SUMF1/EgtB/PvdO family nonheme iron enzyme [Muribaculaceae bacterium]
MKRKMTIIRRCLIAFAYGMLLVGAVSMSAPPRVSINVCGDVTGEGVVDVADVNSIINIILEQKTSADYPGNADASGDNVVDVSDVNAVINIILGLDPVVTEYTIDDVSFKMVEVEGGTFTMGPTEEQGSDPYDNEKPAHQVTLSNYSIGKTEVTQELWVKVMGTNPSTFTGDLQLPVDSLIWDECQEFITKLNQLTGKTFRLPTEAEWEYAARGGNKSKHYKYAGGDNIEEVGWYKLNSDGQTHPVCLKKANELGLYDMCGNVMELCQDWYLRGYSSEPQIDPIGPDTGGLRVNRGGCYDFNARLCRVSCRGMDFPGFRVDGLGVRLAQ